jgi:PAS domain S-box-containing protein/putative nucleotidyltransferase with HDIG domain
VAVESVETLAGAVDRLASADIDVALLDLGLPDSQGLETFSRLRDAAPGVAIVVLTANSDVALAVRAVEEGAQDFLVKGRVDGELLTRAVAYALGRQQAEEELRESEERYRSVLNASPDDITITDLEGRILMVSPAALTIFGCDREGELLGHSVTDFIVLEDRDRTASNIALMFQGTPSGPTEYRGLRADGSTLDIAVNAALIRDADRQPTNAVFIVRDITERKRSENALVLSESRLKAMFEQAPMGINLLDSSTGRIHEVNPRYLEITGWSEEELVARGWEGITHPDDVQQELRSLSRMVAGEIDGFTMEKRYVRPDGSIIWANLTVSSIAAPDGSSSRHLCMVEDITERKQAEQELASSESRLKAMFDQAPSGIALIDSLTGHIREANPMFARIAGRTIEEMRELDWMSIAHPDDVQADLDNMALMNAGETNGFQMEKPLVRPDGSTVWISVTVAPVLVGDEAPPQHVRMIEDITADKAAEELLARQKERIERTLTSVIDIAGNIVEVRDPYTAGHQRRVAELAARIAQDLGMSDLEVADIHVAGLLHDMGKAGVPTEILGKPGVISPVEFELIKGHAQAGYEIALSAHMEEPIPEMIHEHHERCDGSGYPLGLIGDQILLGAKVLAVADVVEAMMSHRPYRPALGIEAALAEIERGTGRLYDAEVSSSCVALFREGHFEFSS